MLAKLHNTPLPYAWGSTEALAQWQGKPAPGGPQAELWLGTHSASEAWVEHQSTHEHLALSAWLAQNDHEGQLPFLVKLLAAGGPLSIQVHPSRSQAEEGFAREDALGIHVSDPTRTYRDTSDKPEIIVAWSDTFEALAGFQSLTEMVRNCTEIDDFLGDTRFTSGFRAALDEGIGAAISFLLSGNDSVCDLAVAITTKFTRSSPSQEGNETTGSLSAVWNQVVDHFPNDPGIVMASFMNHLRLRQGEALFIPSGVVHAYLQGFGLEVMAPSDNVVRGGLTPKNIDRQELDAIALKESSVELMCRPELMSPTMTGFRPEGVPFDVLNIHLDNESVALEDLGVAVIVVLSGTVSVKEDAVTPFLTEGSAYIYISGGTLTLAGEADIYVVRAR